LHIASGIIQNRWREAALRGFLSLVGVPQAVPKGNPLGSLVLDHLFSFINAFLQYGGVPFVPCPECQGPGIHPRDPPGPPPPPETQVSPGGIPQGPPWGTLLGDPPPSPPRLGSLGRPPGPAPGRINACTGSGRRATGASTYFARSRAWAPPRETAGLPLGDPPGGSPRGSHRGLSGDFWGGSWA
jgi:hypothetical protein